jgi:hypothetical protein
MKSKLLFLTALMLIAVFGSFAQITTTGVAIQGIAREAATNNAITNSSIGLKFTVYYGSALTNAISPISITLTTDAFGVFSYILDVSGIENKIFYDNQLMLKIEQTSPSSGVISDEKLNFVPYAVSASNGVPTGSIMPFVGTIAPRGWALCDGSALPSSAGELKTLLVSNNAPDLRGMFIRGAGTNSNPSYNNNVGPAVKVIQTELIKSHALTVTDNGHEHGITDPGHRHLAPVKGGSGGGSNFGNGDGGDPSNSYLTNSNTTGITKANNSVTNVNVNYVGGTETRPVNYGVNYIIKL